MAKRQYNNKYRSSKQIQQLPPQKKISAQSGPQTDFLSSTADIAIYGGSAGSGKSYSILLEPLRHYYNPLFRAVFFRRTTPQLKTPGGLWDEAQQLYRQLGGHSTHLDIKFPSGCEIKFAHMEYESNMYDWQGAQIPLICFDELTHFTEKQFFYMISRNRSTSGARSCIRATCNPDPNGWVRSFISWWIGDDGYPIPSRAGKLRHFVRAEGSDEIIWQDAPFSIGTAESKSVTFIPALISDNKILLEKDPSYLASLNALPYVDRMQLLHGNWNVKPAAGMFFKRHWFEIVDALPVNTKVVRYWDRAASESKSADFTVGVKMHRAPNNLYFIEDVIRFRGTPLKVEQSVYNTARQDKITTTVWIEQDPGQAGISEAEAYVRLLTGFSVKLNRVSTSKQIRAKPLSAQCERGNIKLLRGKWNDSFLSELESFPDSLSKDDQVDAASGAFNALASDNVGEFTAAHVPRGTPSVSLRGGDQW